MTTLTKSKVLSFLSVKAVLLAAILTGTGFTTSTAHARPHHGGYYDHGRHHYRHHKRHNYRHHRRHGYRHHRKHHRDRDLAYLAGGLIIGGIIVDALHHNRSQGREEQYPQVRVSRDTVVERHLHRDRYGNCFERLPDGTSNELPPAYCDW